MGNLKGLLNHVYPPRALDDHSSVRTLAFLGRALNCTKFRDDKARRAVRNWENLAADFLTMGTRVLVVHFEVRYHAGAQFNRHNFGLEFRLEKLLEFLLEIPYNKKKLKIGCLDMSQNQN